MKWFFDILNDKYTGRIFYSFRDEAFLTLFNSIEVYYNRARRHSTLGYVLLINYEQMMDQENRPNV
jgi:putative transposase